MDKLQSLLEVFSQAYSPFNVNLDGFSTFPPRVIFIDVQKTPPLTDLQKNLEELARSNPAIFHYNYDDHPYHPHLTLAFKDLTKSNFHRAWKEFKGRKFDETFTADKISLLQHNGKRWEVIEEYGLGI